VNYKFADWLFNNQLMEMGTTPGAPSTPALDALSVTREIYNQYLRPRLIERGKLKH